MTKRLLSIAFLSGILVLVATLGVSVSRVAEAAPGVPAAVAVTPSTFNATCGVPVNVQVQVVDSLGAPVPGTQGVTLTTTYGTLSPSVTGTTNGVANVTLNTVAGSTGTAVITASSSGFMGQATVNVTCSGLGSYCGLTLCQPCTVYGCGINTCYYAYNCYAGCTSLSVCGSNCPVTNVYYYTNVCTANCSFYGQVSCGLNCGGLVSCPTGNCGLVYTGYGCNNCMYGYGYYYTTCNTQPVYTAPPVTLPPVQASYNQPTYTAPTTQASYTTPSTQPSYSAPAQQPQPVYTQPAPQQQAQGRPFFPPNTGNGGLKGVSSASTSPASLPFFAIVGVVFAVGIIRLRRSASATR